MRFVFFVAETATTEIYTLSLHDALPISGRVCKNGAARARPHRGNRRPPSAGGGGHGRRPVGGGGDYPDGAEHARSEEHTSELQSHSDLVCRLLLEKKKKKKKLATQESHS